MKRLISILLISAGVFLSGCEKHRFFEKHELNNKGDPEKVMKANVDGKFKIFYLEPNKDTVYIYSSSKEPSLWGFGFFPKDMVNDDYRDFFRHKDTEGGIKTFVKYNRGNGTFSEEQELGQ